MDWADTPEQAEFRAQVQAVIREELPERYRNRENTAETWERDRKSSVPEERAAAEAWSAALSKRGWFAPHWPKEYGGGGLSTMEQFILRQEIALHNAPAVGGQGARQLGSTLIVHGSEEQKREHLPRILSGEVNWRQGYSEPGSGSDLASLQTRAVRDGDDYVVNGQKIWTSGAQWADWLYVLVRTDPEAPKHLGISFLLVEKNTPGISVRPLINMGWEHHFNETFFENVRIPANNLVGQEHRGWYVGATLLDFERSNIDGAIQAKRSVGRLVDLLANGKVPVVRKAAELAPLRSKLAERAIETEVQYNFSLLVLSLQSGGGVPNHEASVAKLYSSELSQRLDQTGVSLLGLYGNIWEDDEDRTPFGGRITRRYVGSLASTIAGGTSEIQRNVIATRGLGLPRG